MCLQGPRHLAQPSFNPWPLGGGVALQPWAGGYLTRDPLKDESSLSGRQGYAGALIHAHYYKLST